MFFPFSGFCLYFPITRVLLSFFSLWSMFPNSRTRNYDLLPFGCGALMESVSAVGWASGGKRHASLLQNTPPLCRSVGGRVSTAPPIVIRKMPTSYSKYPHRFILHQSCVLLIRDEQETQLVQFQEIPGEMSGSFWVTLLWNAEFLSLVPCTEA